MNKSLIISLVLTCAFSSITKAQTHPQFSFYGASEAETLFHDSKNDYDRYLKSKLFVLFYGHKGEILTNGELIALYNMYLYERSSIIEIGITDNKNIYHDSSFDFGAKVAAHSDNKLYFESPVKRIDPHIFNESLSRISLPRIKGITYGSSRDIMVKNLVYIDGYNVIDHKVLLDDNGKMIVAATGCEDVFVIPDGVAQIGEGALRGSGCTSIVVPASVKSIGGYAFDKCLSLRSVYLRSSTPEKYITSSVFGSTSLTDITFYVPRAALKSYKKMYPEIKRQFKKDKSL